MMVRKPDEPTNVKTEYNLEAGSAGQPDPLLHEGRSSRAWIWTVAVVIVVALIVVFFAMNGMNRQAAQNRPAANPPITAGSSSTPPQPALPAGRTTSAPPLNGQSQPVQGAK